MSHRRCEGAHLLQAQSNRKSSTLLLQSEQGLASDMLLRYAQLPVISSPIWSKWGKKETKAPSSTNFSLLLGLSAFCSLTLNSYNSKCFDGLKDKRGAFKYSRDDLFIVLSSIVSEARTQVVEAG